MMKKIAALAGAGAILLSVAVPIFAYDNFAIIKGNDATAVANTGMNTQGNGVSVKKAGVGGSIGVSGNNSMNTGNAYAKARVGIVANVSCDGCGGGLAVVKWNDAEAYADSGLNTQGNGVSVKKAHVDGSIGVSGNNSMNTGNAYAKAKVFVVVNSSWIF